MDGMRYIVTFLGSQTGFPLAVLSSFPRYGAGGAEKPESLGPALEGKHHQWSFLVPLIGGIGGMQSPNWQGLYHLYTTYILVSGGLYATYHLFMGTRNNH